jgi:hypothetical protein
MSVICVIWYKIFTVFEKSGGGALIPPSRGYLKGAQAIWLGGGHDPPPPPPINLPYL